MPKILDSGGAIQQAALFPQKFSPTTAFRLWILGGILGLPFLHQIYLRRWKQAGMYFFTVGFLYVGWLQDLSRLNECVHTVHKSLCVIPSERILHSFVFDANHKAYWDKSKDADLRVSNPVLFAVKYIFCTVGWAWTCGHYPACCCCLMCKKRAKKTYFQDEVSSSRIVAYLQASMSVDSAVCCSCIGGAHLHGSTPVGTPSGPPLSAV